MPRPRKGEKTPGSGIKKGQKHAATLEKDYYRRRALELFATQFDPILHAQMSHALGVKYMILRHPDGTYARATDAKQIDAACAVGAQAFEIVTQSPNTQAFTALWDRSLDKPKDQPQELTITGTINVVDVLKQRQQRRKKAE